MTLLRKLILAGLSAAALLTAPIAAFSQETDQVGRQTYLDTIKGKKVIFIPISQGMDLNQAWVVVWQRHAARYGCRRSTTMTMTITAMMTSGIF